MFDITYSDTKKAKYVANLFQEKMPEILDILGITGTPPPIHLDDCNSTSGSYYDINDNRIYINVSKMVTAHTNSIMRKYVGLTFNNNDTYYVFVLAHELHHFKQVYTKQLQQNAKNHMTFFWEGQLVDIPGWFAGIEKRMTTPWEIAANNAGKAVVMITEPPHSFETFAYEAKAA